MVAAPTGSGKTGIFELAIARLLLGASERGTQSGPSHSKTIYIAPVKALCSERVKDWTRKMAQVSGLFARGFILQ